MKVVRITRPGGPEVLALATRDDPDPGPAEVRVRVRATALNRADLLQRRGLYPAPPGAPPDVPGLEFAGKIDDCGRRVTQLRPGDRVMGLLPGGGYAERVCLPAELCLPVPAGLSWEAAAAIPEAFLTAWDALFRRAGLVAGEAVLVHAAGSGVGTAAVQLARAAGARPIALSRTADKRQRLAALGAVCALDPGDAGVAAAIGAAAPGGVAVVLDLVGAGAWSLNFDVLGQGGRIVVVGLLGGSRTEIDLARLLARRASLIGTVLRSRNVAEKADLVREFADRALPLFEAKRLRPVVDRVWPLEQAAEAHRVMERNENFGKLVLRVGGGGP